MDIIYAWTWDYCCTCFWDSQLAVLEKRIAPEDVALYWVSQDDAGAATLTPIEVKPDATLEGWLPGVFEQEQELAHKILDARWPPRGAT